MSHRLQQFFFAAEDARGLGICRLLFFLWLFLFYLPVVDGYHAQDVAAFAEVGSVFWQPVFPFSFLGLPPPAHPWVDWVSGLWKLSLLTAALGLWSRVSMTIACLLGAYVLALPFQYGKISHNTGPVLLTLGILMLSRAGDACSVDAWLRGRRGAQPPAPSGEYRWPIRFVWVVLAVVYLSAAVSKLRLIGFAYLDPDTLAGMLRQRIFAWNSRPWTTWGWDLADRPWLCSLLGGAILCGELGFATVLWSRWARRLLVPGMLLGHLGIAALLGPRFFQFAALYLFFVPWQRLLPRD